MTWLTFKPFWRAPLVAAIGAMPALPAAAALHDAFPGQDALVHYVRLSGFAGDNAVNRNALQIEQAACVARKRALGLAFVTVAPADIPAIPISADVELYYGAARTLALKQGVLQHIDGQDCSVAARPYRRLEFRSAGGRCDVDMLKKQARGQCDDAARQRGSGDASPPPPGGKLAGVDMAKVPPALRAQVAAQMARLKHIAPVMPAPPSSGVFKTVAGHRCELYHMSALHSELCVAHPDSAFAIPAAPLNAGIAGLLLEAKTDALTLVARQVLLNLAVSGELFALPADVALAPLAKGPP